MFQDLDVRFDNSFQKTAPAEDSLALLFRGDAVLARAEEDRLVLPAFPELPPALRALPFRCAFTLGGRTCFLADADHVPEEAAPFVWVPSRQYRGMGPKEAVFAAAVGESLHRWYAATRFCGRCGRPMEDSAAERARVCPACGLTPPPRSAPR